jgi:hypothetical protein
VRRALLVAGRRAKVGIAARAPRDFTSDEVLAVEGQALAWASVPE